MPYPRGKVNAILFRSIPFARTNNFAPSQLYFFPFRKTVWIQAERPNRSALLNPERFTAQSELVGLLLVRYRQLIAAFRSAALQDKTSAAGSHSGAKTEFPGAFCLAGLVCPFHGSVDSFICKNPDFDRKTGSNVHTIPIIQQETIIQGSNQEVKRYLKRVSVFRLSLPHTVLEPAENVLQIIRHGAVYSDVRLFV